MNKNPEPKKIGRPRKVEKLPEVIPEKTLVESETFTISPEHKYEQHILKLQTMQGFYDEYISRLGYTSSNAEAYETTEVFFQAYFGKRRFKNYDSFRARMSQFQNEKK
jgi:hypothetical protein